MVNKWVNPPPKFKVEDEFDNSVPIDYSPADVWNKVTTQVGKKKSKKRKPKDLSGTH